MSDTFTCPHCGKEIEISEAFKHQLEDKVREEEKEKFKSQLEKGREEAAQSAAKKVREELDISLKERQEELEEAKKRSKDLQEQMLEMTRLIRQLKQEGEDQKLEMAKTLAKEEEKIRDEARKKAEEEQHLKNLEREKQLQDALKANEDLRRKLEQGSQQTQGEVLELELEEMLRAEFPNDEIVPVAKGVRGADVVQKVIDRNGRGCGTILWESKNAKWQNDWPGKLRDDQREKKAEYAVLVSVNLPEDIKSAIFRDGIWLTRRDVSLALAYALRLNLIQLYMTKMSAVGKNEKMETIYSYLTGTEFRQRVEAIVEAFSGMQDELEKEKRWFAGKWARQEKSIRKVIDQTHGMYGDLQGMIGSALPELSATELPEITDGEIN